MGGAEGVQPDEYQFLYRLSMGILCALCKYPDLGVLFQLVVKTGITITKGVLKLYYKKVDIEKVVYSNLNIYYMMTGCERLRYIKPSHKLRLLANLTHRIDKCDFLNLIYCCNLRSTLRKSVVFKRKDVVFELLSRLDFSNHLDLHMLDYLDTGNDELFDDGFLRPHVVKFLYRKLRKNYNHHRITIGRPLKFLNHLRHGDLLMFTSFFRRWDYLDFTKVQNRSVTSLLRRFSPIPHDSLNSFPLHLVMSDLDSNNVKAYVIKTRFLRCERDLVEMRRRFPSVDLVYYLSNTAVSKKFVKGGYSPDCFIYKITLEDLNSFIPNGRIAKNLYWKMISCVLEHNDLPFGTRKELEVVMKLLRNRRIMSTKASAVWTNVVKYWFLIFVSVRSLELMYKIPNQAQRILIWYRAHKTLYFPECRQIFMSAKYTPTQATYILDNFNGFNSAAVLNHYVDRFKKNCTVESRTGEVLRYSVQTYIHTTPDRTVQKYFLVHDTDGHSTYVHSHFLSRRVKNNEILHYKVVFDLFQRPLVREANLYTGWLNAGSLVISFKDFDADFFVQRNILYYNEREGAYDIHNDVFPVLAKGCFLRESLGKLLLTQSAVTLLFLNNSSAQPKLYVYTDCSGSVKSRHLSDLIMFHYSTDFINSVNIDILDHRFSSLQTLVKEE